MLLSRSALHGSLSVGLLCLALCSGGETALQRFEYSQIQMGVAARIVVYAPNRETAERACTAAFKRFAELEDVMSDYRPTSELMRLCARAGGAPVPVSEDLFDILERALDFAERSDGAFDPTVGPLIQLWRKARREQILPKYSEILEAQRLTGWRNVILDRKKRTAQLQIVGMRLDLGGIGKGYACDAAQTVLKKWGVRRALVEAGGDIVVSEPPPGKRGWGVEVVHPGPNTKHQILLLKHVGISSSGDTEQFVEIGGVRYSHIVNPKTGVGLTDRIAVTVIAPNGTVSDGLSTALSVLGKEAGEGLAENYRGVRVSIRQVH